MPLRSLHLAQNGKNGRKHTTLTIDMFDLLLKCRMRFLEIVVIALLDGVVCMVAEMKTVGMHIARQTIGFFLLSLILHPMDVRQRQRMRLR